MTTTLLHLPMSPWSERARWALDTKRVPYTTERYQPLLGELHLWRLRRGHPGPVSVPVLVREDGPPLCDSVEIAKWADARGSGPSLFPADRLDEIGALVALADRAADAGRARALRRMAASEVALQEQVPDWLAWGGAASRRLARFGVERLLAKYRGEADGVARTQLLGALDELREWLERGSVVDGAKVLLGQFTFADIAAAQALAFVRPPEGALPLGPGSREAYTDPYVAAVSEDLLAWRDALYARFR